MATATVISRQDAHAQGKLKFYTGQPCKHGHVAERYVSTGGCTLCLSWSSNKKLPGPRAANVGWPPRGLRFDNLDFTPTPDEIAAAYLYVEAAGWLTEAIKRVHGDPELLAKYMPPLSLQEQIELRLKLERDEIARAAQLERAQSGGV